MTILSFDVVKYCKTTLDWEIQYNKLEYNRFLYRHKDNKISVKRIEKNIFWDIINGEKNGLIEFVMPNLGCYNYSLIEAIINDELREGDEIPIHHITMNEEVANLIKESMADIIQAIVDNESSINN